MDQWHPSQICPMYRWGHKVVRETQTQIILLKNRNRRPVIGSAILLSSALECYSPLHLTLYPSIEGLLHLPPEKITQKLHISEKSSNFAVALTP